MKSLPCYRYVHYWAQLEGPRYRIGGLGKTHRKSDSIDSSEKIHVADITCFGKIFLRSSYLFRETRRNKNLFIRRYCVLKVFQKKKST